MALTVRAMDVSMEKWGEQSLSPHHLPGPVGQGAALAARMAPATSYFASDQKPPLQRADTPCPAAMQANRRGASFVLLPDGAGYANRRLIELGAGTCTVVGAALVWGVASFSPSGVGLGAGGEGSRHSLELYGCDG